MDDGRLYARVTDAAEAVGIKPSLASQWILDGLLGNKKRDKLATVPGATTLLSPETAVALAIAAQLRKMGASRETACGAGKAFAALKVPAADPDKASDDSPSSWLIVFLDGDIAIAPFVDPPTKRQMEQDHWRICWQSALSKLQGCPFRMRAG